MLTSIHHQTSTDSVARLFTALNMHVIRRPFHWGGNGENGFFANKSGAQNHSATKYGTHIAGMMLDFF